MSITVPAFPDCKECDGKGQTVGRDGYTAACLRCWGRNIRKALSLADRKPSEGQT